MTHNNVVSEIVTKDLIARNKSYSINNSINKIANSNQTESLKSFSVSEGMAASISSPATLIINTPPSISYFESPSHVKFADSNEPPNLNKRKRTDKGVSFGKYSSSGGIQDIHHIDDYLDSKSSHMRKRRRRRETSKSIGLTVQNGINTYPRKDLTRSVELIRLIELNATIDYSYCTKLQCTQGLGSKFHYIIPISKFMDLEYVTLQFRYY